MAFRFRKMHGRPAGEEITFIERYCDSVHLLNERYLEYLMLCSPFIAQLKDETRIKMYELANQLLFGVDAKIDKVLETKTVMNDIKREFKNIRDVKSKEITSDKGENFMQQFKGYI